MLTLLNELLKALPIPEGDILLVVGNDTFTPTQDDMEEITRKLGDIVNPEGTLPKDKSLLVVIPHTFDPVILTINERDQIRLIRDALTEMLERE